MLVEEIIPAPCFAGHLTLWGRGAHHAMLEQIFCAKSWCDVSKRLELPDVSQFMQHPARDVFKVDCSVSLDVNIFSPGNGQSSCRNGPRKLGVVIDVDVVIV